MRLNTLQRLFALVLDYSTRWRVALIPTEMPSRRYVRRLRPVPTPSKPGRGEMTMGKLEDPNFRYIPKSESEKPGYLERRMKIYKEMVKNESVRAIHPQSKKGDDKADHGSLSGEPSNGLQSRKLAVVARKA